MIAHACLLTMARSRFGWCRPDAKVDQSARLLHRVFRASINGRHDTEYCTNDALLRNRRGGESRLPRRVQSAGVALASWRMLPLPCL